MTILSVITEGDVKYQILTPVEVFESEVFSDNLVRLVPPKVTEFIGPPLVEIITNNNNPPPSVIVWE